MVNVVERKFSVLSEIISPENVLVLAELLALKETKWLIARAGSFAIDIHKKLYSDIMNSHIEGYIFTDSYDLVQTVAVFLCEHFGEYLDDYLYTSSKGIAITIKLHSYHLVNRVVSAKYRKLKSYVRLESLTRANEPKTVIEDYQEQDYSKVDKILNNLDLTETQEAALNCRMGGASYPEIGRYIGRAQSTVFSMLGKVKQKYINLYGDIE